MMFSSQMFYVILISQELIQAFTSSFFRFLLCNNRHCNQPILDLMPVSLLHRLAIFLNLDLHLTTHKKSTKHLHIVPIDLIPLQLYIII
jgi:hypothetical protein